MKLTDSNTKDLLAAGGVRITPTDIFMTVEPSKASTVTYAGRTSRYINTESIIFVGLTLSSAIVEHKGLR